MNMGMFGKKLAEFGNHQIFTLRCLDYGIIPTSCRLKNPIRMPNSYDIIRKAERQLMNERERNINNSLDLFGMRKDTCRNQLAVIFDKELFRECLKLNSRIKLAGHLMTLTRQLRKFDRLQHNYYGVHSYNHKHVHTISLLHRNFYISSNNTGNDNTKNNNRINNNDDNDDTTTTTTGVTVTITMMTPK